MSTARQCTANRLNGLLGGVKTPEGKAISRLNARKHGIFASALTPLDAQELQQIEQELLDELQPVNHLELLLIETLAMTSLRLQRCALAEAQYHQQAWAAPAYLSKAQKAAVARGEQVIEFHPHIFEQAVKLFDTYQQRLLNQFLRLITQLQSLRAHRPAPSSDPAPSPSSPIPAPDAESPVSPSPNLPVSLSLSAKTNPISESRAATPCDPEQARMAGELALSEAEGSTLSNTEWVERLAMSERSESNGPSSLEKPNPISESLAGVACDPEPACPELAERVERAIVHPNVPVSPSPSLQTKGEHRHALTP